MTYHLFSIDDLELVVDQKDGQPIRIYEDCDGGEPIVEWAADVKRVRLTTLPPCPDTRAHRPPGSGLLRRFLRWLV